MQIYEAQIVPKLITINSLGYFQTESHQWLIECVCVKSIGSKLVWIQLSVYQINWI